MSNVNNGSLGFCGTLTIVLVVLKLVGKIDWSWWWVWSPCLIPLGIFLVAMLGATIYAIFKTPWKEER